MWVSPHTPLFPSFTVVTDGQGDPDALRLLELCIIKLNRNMTVIFEQLLITKRDFTDQSVFVIMHSSWEEAAGVTKRSSTFTFKTDIPER